MVQSTVSGTYSSKQCIWTLYHGVMCSSYQLLIEARGRRVAYVTKSAFVRVVQLYCHCSGGCVSPFGDLRRILQNACLSICYLCAKFESLFESPGPIIVCIHNPSWVFRALPAPHPSTCLHFQSSNIHVILRCIFSSISVLEMVEMLGESLCIALPGATSER